MPPRTLEVIGLLRDETRRTAMRKNAHKLGREMIWSNTARLYQRSFELARLEGAVLSRKSFATKTLDQAPRELPEFKLDHLARMTDSTGLFQHAVFTAPNFSEGYLYGRQLIIPCAMSDYATTFATLSLDDVLAAME